MMLKTCNNFKKKFGKKKDKKKRTGPRLPVSLQKELNDKNPNNNFNIEEEGDDDVYVGKDVYEYEEGVAEEESKKNRRFDSVENYEYKLPEDFEDEDVESDDDDNDLNSIENKIAAYSVKKGDLDQLDDDVEDEDDERHLRVLQGITGMPSQAFEGGKKKNIVVSEAYPESEYNPTRDVLDGNGHIAIEDLLESIQGQLGYGDLQKKMRQVEKKSILLQAPLPKEDRDRLERKAAYEKSKKDITKWEPLVKRNREAPTIIFEKDTDLGFSTVGAIASEFEPRTEFEKKMSSLVYDDKVMEAHREDGSRLLELNKISLEDYVNNRNHVVKMRSLLFRHELKMKRVKKIKSKTYHRLLKKDRLKSGSVGVPMDAEEAKELAMKQEFKRAEERMTLRHKNQSKWAQRIVRRGSNAQDEGTRAAMAEQLHQHARLTRKMNSMKDSSSSDDSSNEENSDDADGSDRDEVSKVVAKAKEKTLKVLEENDEMPDSGVLSLPFMKRALKKRKEAADEEARLALQEFESSLKESEDTDGAENMKTGTVSGRRVFGASRLQVAEPNNKVKPSSNSSDSEAELEAEDIDVSLGRTNDMQKNTNVDPALLNFDSNIPQDSVPKGTDIVRGSGPKRKYEVAMLQSDKWRKMSSQNEVCINDKKSPKFVEPVMHNQDIELEELGEESDTDSGGQMVDGILSSENKSSYKLPSQADLIREAFAGDDVQEEFSKDKEEILNEENPESEKPAQLPGWGQWTHIQKKKGLPTWVLEEQECAKRKRGEALRKRKDAHLKHVIISEKLDKKAEKLLTGTLPYPFTSKEAFEQNIRMPIGPEFNPVTAVGALNRPEVVKKPGLIIKPIKYEDVDPHEREVHRGSGPKQRQKPRLNRSEAQVKAVKAKS